MVQMNLSNVEAKDFSPIPGGDYKCYLVKTKEGTSLNGKDFIECEYKVSEGDHKGRALWDRLFLTDKSLFRFKMFAEGMKFNCDRDFETADMMMECTGKAVILSVSIDSYEKDGVTKKVNRVEGYKVCENQSDGNDEVFP